MRWNELGVDRVRMLDEVMQTHADVPDVSAAVWVVLFGGGTTKNVVEKFGHLVVTQGFHLVLQCEARIDGRRRKFDGGRGVLLDAHERRETAGREA